MKIANSNKNIWFPTVFDELFTPGFFETSVPFNSANLSVPAVNIKETENKFEVELAVPGRSKEDFNIELEDNVLSISSENKGETTQKDKDRKYTRREFSYNSFKRTFTLPEIVDEENIKASYENGVLEISIPKKEEVLEDKKKLIEIL